VKAADETDERSDRVNKTEMSIYDKFDHPDQLAAFGKAICLSEMFGCTNASQGMVLAMECAARKTPILSLAERYHLIHGRLSMKSEAMLADFRTRCGGSHRILARTPSQAKIELSLKDDVQEFKLTWTDALQEPFVYVGKEAAIVQKLQKEKKELIVKSKYSTPRARMQMLWARVVSDGVRAMAPEVVSGHYTPEEIGDFDGNDDVIDDNDDVIDVEVKTAPVSDTGPVPDAQPEPESPPRERQGVRLGGQGDPYVVDDMQPCGKELGEGIKLMADRLGLPPEKRQEIVSRYDATSWAEIPSREAYKLISRLRQKLSDDDIPF
jgi:hypothetical protein